MYCVAQSMLSCQLFNIHIFYCCSSENQGCATIVQLCCGARDKSGLLGERAWSHSYNTSAIVLAGVMVVDGSCTLYI